MESIYYLLILSMKKYDMHFHEKFMMDLSIPSSPSCGNIKANFFGDPPNNVADLNDVIAETLLNESKDDDNSTENGSNNGEVTSQLGGLDPSSMLGKISTT